MVTDPPSDDMGYDRPRIRADVVTISHEHPGHNNRVGFRGGPKIFDGPGEYEVKGVFITGIATYHDSRSGSARGGNTVFLFEFGGITVCHLGDLGHVPSQTQVEALSDVNVLLIPVGGLHTIDAAKAAEVISLIEPNLVVPMHFKTPVEGAKLHTIDKFLKEMGLASIPPVPELKVTKSSLPEETEVVLLDYTRS
jgi:L-ascorbate metabolism protein UlaG (beta-lactamase superfamily)